MSQTDLIQQTALETIQNEGSAILNLQQYINDSFSKVINIILNCRGRIIISGIGKSAIVAQKIVSTLNSTGSPALYMHAADAIHGDLGMIQSEDLVIIISKSGESPEIKYLLPIIKSFGNTTIAMVGNNDSYLAKVADYIIPTFIEEEACPHNLAPTTSTTAQMVMGDVLAVCLMKIKGFQSAHFAKYHPGGALGKKLYTTVSDLYKNNEKPMVYETTDLKNVIIEISKKRLGATAVVNEQNELKGIITDGDIRRCFEKNDTFVGIKAKDIMNTTVKSIDEEVLAIDALQLMKKNDITQLVVTHNNHYLGIIHLHEILKEGIV